MNLNTGDAPDCLSQSLSYDKMKIVIDKIIQTKQIEDLPAHDLTSKERSAIHSALTKILES